MTSEKVGLREQIKKSFLATIETSENQKVSLGELSRLYDDVLAVVDLFLEPSPQTQEIQKLLENRPKLESIDVECSRTLAVYEHWFQIFEPKLEALLTDRRKLEKLIEDPELLEKLAELEHEQWSHIINYLLDEGCITLARFKSFNYKQLAKKPYEKLREGQKDSDREWARKVLAVFRKRLELLTKK